MVGVEASVSLATGLVRLKPSGSATITGPLNPMTVGHKISIQRTWREDCSSEIGFIALDGYVYSMFFPVNICV